MFRCRAIVFDLDGTLVDSFGPIATSLNAARRAAGKDEVPESQVRRDVGYGIEALIAKHLGPEAVAEGVANFRRVYEEVFAAGTVPLPGVPDRLAEFAARGARLAIASNKLAHFGRRIADAVGLTPDVVPVVLGPDSGVAPKPDPAMLRLAMVRLGVGAGETLYVGDMPLDAVTAANAGTMGALVSTGSGALADLERTGLPVYASLEALLRDIEIV